MTHAAFMEGLLAEEATWQAVVLVPKGGGYYCGIGLMEVVCRVVMVIFNCHFTYSIVLHDVLHRFLTERIIRAPSFEFKLLQKLTSIR